MSAGFSVILDDLANAARVFGVEAALFGQLGGRIPADGVDGGDAVLNAAIVAAFALLRTADAALAGRLQSHAGKLSQCHDNYRSADADLAQVYGELMSGD
jgi:hypothetical protein